MALDLSKQGLQNFFLYHTEKVVLFICVLLMGFFLWMGLQKEAYTDNDPSKLIQLASRANDYINRDDAWEQLTEYREGRDNAPEILKGRVDVNGSDYIADAFRGTAAATLQPRNDPAILKPEQMIASVVPATILVNTSKGFAHVSNLPLPPMKAMTDMTGAGFDPGMGSEGDEGDFGGEGEGDLGDEGGSFGGPPPGGRGGPPGRGRASRRNDPEVIPIPELEGIGTRVLEITEATTVGVRSAQNAGVTKPVAFNVVAVRALIDYKQQAKLFEDTFADAIGYYPDRDKPIYQFLEIQRRVLDPETGKATQGKEGEWTDISEQASFVIPAAYPTIHAMPERPFSSAPDVVSPDNYDPLLTGPIPAFAGIDYTQFVSHPALESKREFPEWTDPNVAEEAMDKKEIFTEKEDDDIFGAPSGGLSGGKFSGMGGMGMGASGPGEGVGGGPGGSLGGGPPPGGLGGRGPGGFGGFGGGSSDPDNENYLRRGSEMQPYMEALEEKTPKENYRLIRFFDVRAKEGVSYEYRVRVWVGDPNHEDPQMRFVNIYKGGMMAGPDFGGPGASDPEGEGDPDSGSDDDPTGSDFNQDPEGESTDDSMLVKQNILSSMLRPNVRIRINAAKEQEKGPYLVSTGGENPEMVPVPEPTYNSVRANYPYHEYLKYARPSEWSDSVRVDVTVDSTRVYAGKTVLPRQVKVTDEVSLNETEPTIEVVASTISEKFQTQVPAKRTVYRGDGFDFFSPAYLLHPVTRQVVVAENENERWRQTPGQYQYEFATGNVMVDAIFGSELPLPRAEKKRHFVPTEVLVMDKNGDFRMSNELDDQSMYRNSLFLGDESRYVGRDRRRKKKKASPDAGRGGKFGGGAGAGAGGPGGDFGG